MEEENVIGFFVSGPINSENSKIFKEYIWGNNGLEKVLTKLKYSDYGADLKLILLQFYVNPLNYVRDNLKEIENYRKNEGAIGIPIIIEDMNFFCLQEAQRKSFLKKIILDKFDLLLTVVKKKKLDTKIELLISDLRRLFYQENT